MGFSDVWASDHVAVPTTLDGTPSFFPEPVPLLSLAAGHTSRVGLGTSVIIGAYRNPMQFAKQWATLDWLAPGRTILGLGAGWLDAEFEACGVDPRRKGKRLDDYISGWRALWSGATDTRERLLHLPRRPGAPAARAAASRSGSAARPTAPSSGPRPTTAGIRPGRRSTSSRATWTSCTPRSTGSAATAPTSPSRCTWRSASANSSPAGYWSRNGDGHGDRDVADGTRDGLLNSLNRYAEIGVQHTVLTPQCRSRQEWDEQLDALDGFPAEMAAATRLARATPIAFPNVASAAPRSDIGGTGGHGQTS